VLGLVQVSVSPNVVEPRAESVIPTKSPKTKQSSGTRAGSRELFDRLHTSGVLVDHGLHEFLRGMTSVICVSSHLANYTVYYGLSWSSSLVSLCQWRHRLDDDRLTIV
jgi:hypothetical protein